MGGKRRAVVARRPTPILPTAAVHPTVPPCPQWHFPASSRAMTMRRTNLFLVLLATVSWAACAVNPATGQRQFSLIGTGQEIEMGREYDQKMVAELGLYPDSAWQAYVRDLGERMARLS